MQVDITIEAKKDVQGVVAKDASFFNYPLDLNNSIMIISRAFSHLLQVSIATPALTLYSLFFNTIQSWQMFVVLLGKGLPVQLHGKGDTAAQLDGLLTEFTGGAGTLVQVRQKLLSYLSTNAPSANSVEYDMHLALLELIKIFEARHPGVDTVLPEVCLSG